MKTHHFAPLLLTLVLFAHFTEAQVRFGVKAGVNLANIGHGALDFDPLLRFQGGVVADIPIATHFSVQPAILYSAKGYSLNLEEVLQGGVLVERKAQIKLKLNYLEIPVLALYKTELGEGVKFFGGLGPYVGIGINGSNTSNWEGYEEKPITFDKNDLSSLNYERFDYGLSAVVGLEFRNIMLGVNYNYGLRQVPIPSKLQNHTLGLTAGYLFGKVR